MANDYEVLELPFDTAEMPKLCLDKELLASEIEKLTEKATLDEIRVNLKNILDSVNDESVTSRWILEPARRYNGNCYEVDPDVFNRNIQQIIETYSLERTIYYLKRLKKSMVKVKTGRINDINLNRWKEYEFLHTDSLWIENKRDRAGSHMASYWGNFIPQIPQQMMYRFTRQGEYVLDTFSGSGTTMIECRRMGRNGIGIELNPEVVKQSTRLIEEQENPHSITTEVVHGNSATIDYSQVLKERNIDKVHLIIMHPPYFDIIKFSENEDDLSNANDAEDFLDRLQDIARNSAKILEDDRYMCLVIGDKYTGGEWIPLGFQAMQRVLDTGHYKLKSIIVKNFQETKGKRSQKELWRYRAMVGGFYIFKHEYIFLFQKH
jgi:DNA modification methylase